MNEKNDVFFWRSTPWKKTVGGSDWRILKIGIPANRIYPPTLVPPFTVSKFEFKSKGCISKF